jgi:multidrug efflux pump subunit AcrB
MSNRPPVADIKEAHHFTNNIVHKFLYSNLALILILLATLVGIAALIITPREEDPQIVVPLADVYVNFPGHSAAEVEQLAASPLEKILYQIDGVEYVYSMSRPGLAIITVRYYVGEDRERSLVKLYKKIDENLDVVPPGVSGWVVKPVEIDDVPVVTLTLTGGHDEMALRRVAEEMTQRLAAVKNVSRAYVVGGRPRVVNIYMNTDAMAGFGVSPLEIQRAIAGANVTQTAGDYQKQDHSITVEVGGALTSADELRNLVVAVSQGRPVFLKDVAHIEDGPAEAVSYVRHGWGPARGFQAEEGFPGTSVGESSLPVVAHVTTTASDHLSTKAEAGTTPAVTIAIAKQRGSNAVWVAQDVLQAADKLRAQIVPSGMDLIVTRNYGLSANEKVNELVEGLAVAIFIVIALLTLGLGWRESLIVAVAVPVVFGLTLAVNLLFGFTINRVTLFALILSLGLLVDDPIVDVENISRHFALRKRATRKIVMEAVAEIRPPLITATLAVIVSFLPMFFITGMMGPYMRPMALNVPVTMVMSMLVAFTITPWLSYHVLKRNQSLLSGEGHHGAAEACDNRRSFSYRIFHFFMAPLLQHRFLAWSFLGIIALLTAGATYLAADRSVPLKMLPFDNKNELLLVLDADMGTTLERTDAAVRDFERYIAGIPEVTDFTSYVGITSPMDFNGLVRHYYLKQGPNVAEIRLDLVGKKNRTLQSHALGLKVRDDLTAIARAHNIKLKIVEVPPGPPVLASVVAEVYGQPDNSYDDILHAADVVHARLKREPGVVDTDSSREAPQTKEVFVTDKEKAALHGISTGQIAATIQTALAGSTVGTVRVPAERNPLLIELRLPIDQRSGTADLAQLRVKGADGSLVQLAELGAWKSSRVDQTIYHKNLQRVAYVFAETAGRPPADVVVDVNADRQPDAASSASLDTPMSKIENTSPRPLSQRTFFQNGSGIPWSVPAGIKVNFAGEGEWKITLDVFRDLGLAFGAAMVMIYVLLVAQTKSFVIPLVVMLAIPLTVLGVMPGFWLLNHLGGHMVGPYANSVFFTATGMIGMIALAGIVTRNSIILVDFIHLSLRRGRSLFDAILDTCVVRLRPILLTASAAMLSAIPIIVDPIFSGLAWSLIFGLFASTLFTLFVIPVSYWLFYAHKPGHGVPDDFDQEELQALAAAETAGAGK